MNWFFSEVLALAAVVGGSIASIVAIVLFSRVDGLDRRVAAIERERTREVVARLRSDERARIVTAFGAEIRTRVRTQA